MAYTKSYAVWKDLPDTSTPMTAAKMQNMDDGIFTADATAAAAIAKSLGTTAGDLIYFTGASTPARLGVGSSGQILTVSGGAPAWADNAAILKSLLTTAGDLIYATGASTPARLGVGSNGQVLTVVSGVPAWAAAAGPTTYRKVTTKDVVNTTTETDLLNGEITLAALAATSVVKVRLTGDYLNNGGGNPTVTLKIKLGATTIYNGVSPAFVASANRRPWDLNLFLVNQNATNVQWAEGVFSWGSYQAPTTGVGSLAAPMDAAVPNLDDAVSLAIAGTAAEDTTSSKALAVTCTHSAANANVSMRLQGALVEVV